MVPNHQRWKLSWNIHTLHTRFFSRLAPIFMLSRCLLTKFLHRSAVGSLLRVRCWLGTQCIEETHCFAGNTVPCCPKGDGDGMGTHLPELCSVVSHPQGGGEQTCAMHPTQTKLPSLLWQVDVPLLSTEECKESGYEAYRITPRMFCAGDVTQGGIDSCQVVKKKRGGGWKTAC